MTSTAPAIAVPHGPEIAGAEQRTVTIQAGDVGALDLHIQEMGAGPPVLLLHGWPQDSFSWRKVMPRLADRHRVVAPDLRGFGRSGAPGSGYDGITFGADALALLDALEIERAHVIGHDWGGFAAFGLGIAAPQRVASMVVLNTIPPWLQPSPRLALELWRVWYVILMATAGDRIVRNRPQLIAKMLRGDRVHDDGIAWEDALAYAERLRRPASARATKLLYRSYLRSFRAVLVERRFADLRLRPPTRFVFGTHDFAISDRMLDGIERHCDDIAVERVPDSGHFIQEEKPELVAERARELFERFPVAARNSQGDN